MLITIADDLAVDRRVGFWRLHLPDAVAAYSVDGGDGHRKLGAGVGYEPLTLLYSGRRDNEWRRE